MPGNLSHATLTYRFVSWILFPGAFLFTVFVAAKYRNGRYLRERMGIYTPPKKRQPFVWCHCASVGEINTALPLLKRLLSQNCSLLVSTNTITGHQILTKAALENTHTIFLPLDYRRFYKKLLAKFLPATCLIFETELWPNLFTTVCENKIPIAVVNGRIGKRTLNAPYFLHENYTRALRCANKIFASSEENAQRFINLGSEAEKITVLDNLKFALPTIEIGDLDRPLTFPYLLCASTHAGEELQIIHHWIQNKPDSLGLVIAIRHPQRAKEVCKQMQTAGLQYALHSKRPMVSRVDQIYIVDTLGELAPFIAHADLVFMGGSLVPLGGHNVLEPAGMEKCILIGPYYENFTAIVGALIDAGGIIVVKDADQLMKTINELMQNKKLRLQTGANAKRYVDSKREILDQYTHVILQLIQHYS